MRFRQSHCAVLTIVAGSSAVVGLWSRSVVGVDIQQTPIPVAAPTVPITDGFRLATIRGSDLAQAAQAQRTVTLAGIPLGSEQAATLELEPVRVFGPNARIVVGRPGGVDEPLAYDTSEVRTFHGKVRGDQESSVVLFSSPRRVSGSIELGGTRGKFQISSLDPSGKRLPENQVAVYPAAAQRNSSPEAPPCGVEAASNVAGCCSEPDPATVFNRRSMTVEIAIETDYELFETFGDLAATADHVTEIMARTNVVFLRDIDVRFEIVFLRLFDNPAAEPAFMSYNNNDTGMLNLYRSYWNANMGAVARDTGAFLSGRRDLSYGGVAYIGAVCTDFAYCICGYLRGFGDATLPEYGEYDVGVVAHELGHNFNACHTPDYCPPIDLCFPPPTVPQRGTLMSYCSQAVSGGDLAEDQWYHTRVRRVMRDFVENVVSCVSYDCNQNAIDDALDIDATSLDVNFDGIPDECQDCDGDGTLDPAEISLGNSTDLNGNALPDDCEPDCNGNLTPDDRDIFLGTSLDVWGNGVPDACDPDCDGDLVADYNQIQSDLTLDLDRNVILDSCQNCDNNGTNDVLQLAGSRSAWVASDVLNYIGQYHSVSGVRMKTSTGGSINSAQDVIIAPGNRVLVSSATDNKVLSFDALSGAYLGDFVASGSGGLSYPTGLIMAPNGNLLVSSRNTDSVLQYDGVSGTSLGAFVAVGSGGLSGPFGLAFGPSGNLFVGAGTNQVLEYNGATGAFVRIFVSAGSGGLSSPRGMLFKPDGNLLVASYFSDAILEYNGTTGAFVRKWNSGGTVTALFLDGPWGLRIGPTGNVYCTRDLPAAVEEGHDHDHDGDFDVADLHVTSARIMEFEIGSGKYAGAYIVGDDTGLRSPTGFAFMPPAGDCDFNLVPDVCDVAACTDPGCLDCNANTLMDRCDIRSGFSVDSNGNLIPDDCEPPPEIVWDSSVTAATRASRTLTMTVPPSASPGTAAIQIKMIDLQHPIPKNRPASPTPDFSAFDTRLNGVCSGATTSPNYNGHHCDADADCDCTAPTCGPTIPISTDDGTCGGLSACAVADGCVRWVGPVSTFPEREGLPFLGTYNAGRLQCTPYYTDWTTLGQFSVFGAEIIPSSTFEARSFSTGCTGEESTCTNVSSPVTMLTRRSCDVASPWDPPDGSDQPNGGDIGELLAKFRAFPGAPSNIAALIFGNAPDPLNIVGAQEIGESLNAFKGLAYPFSGPCECPSVVTCGATPCSISNNPCGAGLCMHTCVGSVNDGLPCTDYFPNLPAGSPSVQCPGGTCPTTGFCRDRCGRCAP